MTTEEDLYAAVSACINANADELRDSVFKIFGYRLTGVGWAKYCPACSGHGYEVQSGHRCNGDKATCYHLCPVQERVACEECRGKGWWFVEPAKLSKSLLDRKAIL